MSLKWTVTKHEDKAAVVSYYNTDFPENEYKTIVKLDPTIKEDALKTQIDLAVKKDFLNHKWVGLQGEIDL